jgi:hypothetical protein
LQELKKAKENEKRTDNAASMAFNELLEGNGHLLLNCDGRVHGAGDAEELKVSFCPTEHKALPDSSKKEIGQKRKRRTLVPLLRSRPNPANHFPLRRQMVWSESTKGDRSNQNKAIKRTGATATVSTLATVVGHPKTPVVRGIQ